MDCVACQCLPNINTLRNAYFSSANKSCFHVTVVISWQCTDVRYVADERGWKASFRRLKTGTYWIREETPAEKPQLSRIGGWWLVTSPRKTSNYSVNPNLPRKYKRNQVGLSTELKVSNSNAYYTESDFDFVEGGINVFESQRAYDYHEDINSDVFDTWFKLVLSRLEPSAVSSCRGKCPRITAVMKNHFLPQNGKKVDI